MTTYKFVHIVNNDKFAQPFLDVIENRFHGQEHLFIYLYGESEDNFPIPEAPNVLNLNNKYVGKTKLFELSKKITPHIKNARKVFLHSLFSIDLVNYLYLHRNLLCKCYWFIWGGDLYSFESVRKTIRNAFGRHRKKLVVKNMGGLVTYLRGDFELAQHWFGAKGAYFECLAYPSNVYKDFKVSVQHKNDGEFTIQVGNSADPANRHLACFQAIKRLANKQITVVCPLSYGNREYAKYVISNGKAYFGDRFRPLKKFLQLDDYQRHLKSIDIAMFGAKRQQGMGNIIALLGYGKKVYIRPDISTWRMFKEKHIRVYDINKLELLEMDEAVIRKNIDKVSLNFSEDIYINQLTTLLEA